MRRKILPLVPVLIVSALVAPTRAAVAESPPPFPEYQAMVDAYVRTYPGIPLDRAITAVLTQGNRARMLEDLGTTSRSGFGGNWYDPRTNTQHVLVTSDVAANTVRAYAARHGVDVAVGRAQYQLSDLEALAKRLNRQFTPEVVKERSVFAVADNTTNRVKVVARTPSRAAEARARHAKDGRIVVEQAAHQAEPTSCTSRNSCGTPMRAGLNFGRDWDAAGPGSAEIYCSTGFTAASVDGAKWATTAGHCTGGFVDAGVSSFCSDGSVGSCWGHGEHYWGPIRDSWPIGVPPYPNVDVARARKDNPYWGTGGYIYNAGAPNSPFDVDHAIELRSTIQVGNTVCRASRRAVTGSYCGTVNNTASHSYGTVSVAGADACGGDSGGGWYLYTGGQRWAAGIHSMNTNGDTCDNDATEYSYFSTVPDIVAYWDETSTLTIRFESR